MAGLHSVLHLATNSMSYDALLFMRRNWSVSSIPLEQFMCGTAIHAAHQTLVAVDELFDLLKKCAEACLPLECAFNDSLNPGGWDTFPMIQFVSSSRRFAGFSRVHAEHLLSAIQNCKKNSVQASCFSLLCDFLSPLFCQVLGDRCDFLCPGEVRDLDKACKSLCFHLRNLPVKVCMPVVKTIVNSWSTSYRYHERAKLKCVFGCALIHPSRPGVKSIDCLSHYIVCKRLRCLLEDLFGTCLPSSRAERLGLVRGSNI